MSDIGSVRWLAARLRRSRGTVLFVAAGGIGNALLAVVGSWATGRALDDALRTGVDTRPLLVLAVLLLASQVIRAGMVYVRQVASIRLGTFAERELRAELVTRVLREGRPQEHGGRLAALISDVRAVRYMITPGVDLALATSAFVAVVLGCAALWSPQLVLAPLLYAAGFAWVSALQLGAIGRAARGARDRSASFTERVTEALDNIEAVRDAGGPDAVWHRLQEAAVAHRDAAVGQGRAERRAPLFLLLGVVQGIGFAHALVLARAGTLTPGDMVGYHSLLLLLGAPTFSSGVAFPALAGGFAAASRLRESLASLPGRAPEGGFCPPGTVPAILVEDVVLDGGRHLPAGLSLELPPCSLAVVTGPVGSGKSTLLRLLAGAERPDAGVVRIAGTDVRQWRQEELARSVVLVADHDSLFSMSLERNIGLGRLDAGPDEIRDAAKQAGVTEFADMLPDGWDTRLGADGTTLSGGQKQRLALSRALLSHADVLLLDDPFSALDAGTARLLATELIEVARTRTVVVVADRADLRAAATHVLHLDDAELSTTHRGE
ncbi:ABC transporter ATP-binding protein [Streptomyces sp. NPDC127084]|uniref:ABC transporter ATP-binding protein n=1 Tax=Streptomyces sp. NPDC127084 TaxID=3347133 RepID=UPI003666EE2B